MGETRISGSSEAIKEFKEFFERAKKNKVKLPLPESPSFEINEPIISINDPKDSNHGVTINIKSGDVVSFNCDSSLLSCRGKTYLALFNTRLSDQLREAIQKVQQAQQAEKAVKN